MPKQFPSLVSAVLKYQTAERLRKAALDEQHERRKQELAEATERSKFSKQRRDDLAAVRAERSEIRKANAAIRAHNKEVRAEAVREKREEDLRLRMLLGEFDVKMCPRCGGRMSRKSTHKMCMDCWKKYQYRVQPNAVNTYTEPAPSIDSRPEERGKLQD